MELASGNHRPRLDYEFVIVPAQTAPNPLSIQRCLTSAHRAFEQNSLLRIVLPRYQHLLMQVVVRMCDDDSQRLWVRPEELRAREIGDPLTREI